MKIGTNKNLAAFLTTGRTYSLAGQANGWAVTLTITHKPRTARGGPHGSVEDIVIARADTEPAALSAANKELGKWRRELGLK